MKEVTGLLVDVHSGECVKQSIEDDRHAYYKALHCDFVEIVYRSIGGRRFCIVCDEEGMLKSGCRVSGIYENGRPALVGSLFICHTSGSDLDSLTDDDFAFLRGFIVTLLYNDGTQTKAIKDISY